MEGIRRDLKALLVAVYIYAVMSIAQDTNEKLLRPNENANM